MGRLPFDPAKMAANQPAVPPAAPTDGAPVSVTQLAARVASALETSLPARLRVIGQVSGFRERTHWYFDLKDAGAVISCVIFASAARRTGFRLQDGQEVVLSGRVEFYSPAGKVSFIADKAEPVGAGALELAFRKLCEELRALGWFDESRKRPLPIFPRKVAVVTSRSGAALQDVLDTARRRCCAVELFLVDARVQGAAAAPEIARALRALGAAHARLGIDAILLTRGGGSMEDLWAFNERIVAQAIIESPIPVIAAIGHETDTTIAELVADVRAATPTQAAMRLIPDGAALDRQAQSLLRRLHLVVDREIRLLQARLTSVARHPFMSDPRGPALRAAEQVDRAARDLTATLAARLHRAHAATERASSRLETLRPANLHARLVNRVTLAAARLARAAAAIQCDVQPAHRALSRAMTNALRSSARQLDAAERQLEAIGPMSVLRRGYSMTLDAKGRVIRNPSDAEAGDRITTRLANGSFESIVDGPAPSKRPAPRKNGPPPPGQIDLF